MTEVRGGEGPAQGTASGVALRAFGDTAVLIDVAPTGSATEALRAVMGVRALLARHPLDGVIDLVPAARTVLVRTDPHRVSLAAVRAWLGGALSRLGGVDDGDADADAEPATVREIDIRYDGPDLDETADLLGVGVEELIARHLAATWSVAFTGFAPGFGYLVSEDWPFEVPRRESPRTRVPAGAVGLAAGFTGAYPRPTPGGWRLIGTTSAPLFSPEAASPALLRPGDTVRFRRTRGAASVATGSTVAPEADHQAAADGKRPGLRIERPGLQATVQDGGRPGAASLGVSLSGALDRSSWRTANRLVGNREDAAALEIAGGGFEAVALGDLWIAVTGARGALSIGGREIDHSAAQLWRSGEVLRLGWFTAGARAYLAVRGGIAAPRVLGSAATDTLAGIGPAPLQEGQTCLLGDDVAGEIPGSDLAPWSPPPSLIEVRVVPGPRADVFPASAVETLFETTWTVSAASDRVGMRLDGPALARDDASELPSEGMVPGAIQVPPSGMPTILLADGPVTGGYPVIATVTDADLDALGQASAGTRIRFRHARPL